MLLALFLAAYAGVARADDDNPASKDEALATRRMEIMRKAIADFQVRSAQIESASALKFRDDPILRYNDQSRLGDNGAQALLDATVWRLGETGRPLAIVTLEIYPLREGTGVLTYEFLSLSPLAFEMKNTRGVRWTPSSTDLVMIPLADGPPPADSPRSRLAQMRELARRFTAQEELRGERIECRMMTQPIDRYEDKAGGIVDGAVFVFANGTNPEMALFLECSDQQWSYGVNRLTSAALFTELDGKSLAVPKGSTYAINEPYTATRHTIGLPD